MFLREVQIKNFRSLKDVVLMFDENTFLIGENNTGKTALLDAIRFALSKTSAKNYFNEYDYYMDSNIASPKDSEGISIILRFEELVAGEWDGYVMDNFGEVIQFMDDVTERGSIIISCSSSYNEATGDFESRTIFLNNEYGEISGKAQNKVGTFLKLTPIFYLQALRDIKDTFNSKSVLWGRFIKKASIPAEQVNKLQEQIEVVNQMIITGDQNLSKLVESLGKIQKVLNFAGKDIVSINAMPMKTWDLLSKAQVVLNNDANHLSLPLERHGQGTQSVTTILLFRAYIEILLAELNSKEATAILALEEPEAHLHPQAVRAINKTLNEIACQKIITTHSPYFVENADLRNIRFFSKKEGVTSIKQIITSIRFKPDTITKEIQTVVEKFSDAFEINDGYVTIKDSLNEKLAKCIKGCCKSQNIDIDSILDEAKNIFTEHELNELNIYVQKTRGEILFARKWFLYEGQTEDIIIPFCADAMGLNFDEHGISGIMYRNNGSAKAFIKLARVLDIEWFLLGDNDDQGKSTLNEVDNCGVSSEEKKYRTALTTELDFEHELSKVDTIFNDYEILVHDNIDEDLNQLKSSGKDEDYKKGIVKLIQKEKVDSAYLLLKRWQERKIDVSEFPEVITTLIKKVCADEQ